MEDRRVIEKFEIERRYWEEKSIDWGIVTENEIPKEFCNNIDWIHDEYELSPIEGFEKNDIYDICDVFKERILNSDCAINRITKGIDKEFNLEIGTTLAIFKHLVARKEIIVDMNKKLSGATHTADIINVLPREQKVITV